MKRSLKFLLNSVAGVILIGALIATFVQPGRPDIQLCCTVGTGTKSGCNCGARGANEMCCSNVFGDSGCDYCQ
jgi:hypothetical protein